MATVFVSGEEARNVVQRLVRGASGQRLGEVADRRIVYGRFGALSEEVVVCRHGDGVEVHCHGGQAAVAAVLDALGQCGCREISWREWIRRRAVDPIEAAAAEALAAAPTLRAAAVLLDQHQGALRREIDDCIRLIAAGDTSAVDQVAECLETLAERWHVGRHLTEPHQVVVAGRPNVGKSSLVNALVGYQRSIVYDQPGTTRDVVSVRTAFDGWPAELSDTAGLRHVDDRIEAAGVELARRRLATADVRLLVFDADQPWSEEDAALSAAWPDAMIVHSKCDTAEPSPDRPRGLRTSAVTGAGIAALVQALGGALVPKPPPPGAAVPFVADQYDCIRNALPALRAGENHRAIASLRRL